MTIKLDIGAGQYPSQGDGWTTVDLYSQADVQADMGALPFDAGAVDEIFCSHALEHVEPSRVPAILAEWFRVLKVGGRATILVPNLDWVAKRWLANPGDPTSIAYMFGLQRDQGDLHRNGWNAASLRKTLQDAGFKVDEVTVIWSHNQETLKAVIERTAEHIVSSEIHAQNERVGTYRSAGDRVLVACPTYLGKSYALEAYIRAYNAFTYPHRGLYLVDNTGTGLTYFEHLKSLKVPCEHIDPTVDFQETFAMCWKRIALHAAEQGYQWVASIEQDNICPPLTLDVLLNVAGYCRAVHVAHSYPWHKSQAGQGMLNGLGCNLISTEVLTAIFAQDKWFTNAIESEIFEYPKLMGAPTVEVHNLLKIEHLDDAAGAEYFHFAREKLPALGAAAAEWQPPRYNKATAH